MSELAASYLTAWLFAATIAAGALVFLMLGHAMSSKWTREVQPVTETIVGALPVLAVLFVPIPIVAGLVYPWVASPPAHLASWLSLPAWTVRSAVYLFVWILFGELLRRRPPATRAIATAGLPLAALTITFAAFDWVMSLTPGWSSTLFGLLVFAGGFVGALALIATLCRVSTRATGALGRLLFAFVIVWAYFEFSQALIQWIANKPDELTWYDARGAGGWSAIAALLVIGHFALPFMALLPFSPKRKPAFLAAVGAWLVAMHYVDTAWLVLPPERTQPSPTWLDLAALVVVAGIAAAVSLARRRLT